MISVRFAGPCFMLATLSACGPGGPSLSGSASESSGSNSGLSSLWEKVRSLGFETGKTYEMPALGIMADAFLADFAARHVETDMIVRSVLEKRNGEIARFDDAVDRALEPTKKSVQANDKAGSAKVTPLDAEHMVYAAPIAVAMQSRTGWEVEAIDDTRVDPAFDTPFFRSHRQPSRYDADLHIRYMEMLAASAIYANGVFGLIDERLGTARLSDPEAAARQVLQTFQTIPLATLRATLQNAVGTVRAGRFSTDLTGSRNIHFTHAPAGDFVADARGMTWTKAGGVWFGDGRINGQAVNLRLASTASLTQKRSQSGNEGVSAQAQLQGTGGISAGK